MPDWHPCHSSVAATLVLACHPLPWVTACHHCHPFVSATLLPASHHCHLSASATLFPACHHSYPTVSATIVTDCHHLMSSSCIFYHIPCLPSLPSPVSATLVSACHHCHPPSLLPSEQWTIKGGCCLAARHSV